MTDKAVFERIAAEKAAAEKKRQEDVAKRRKEQEEKRKNAVKERRKTTPKKPVSQEPKTENAEESKMQEQLYLNVATRGRKYGTEKAKKTGIKKSPLVQASSQIMSIAKRNEDIRFYIHATIKNIDHQRILVLHGAIEQLIKDDTSGSSVFSHKTDYILQYYIDGKPKWLKGRMETMMDYYSARTMTCNDASEDAIRSFLGDDGLLCVEADSKASRANHVSAVIGEI